MLIRNTLSPSSESNTKLSRSRSNIYKNKDDYYKYGDESGRNLECNLEVIDEEKQAQLALQIKQENRVRRIGNIITIVLVLAAIVGVVVWFM